MSLATLEVSRIDTRYAELRLRDRRREKALLGSIAERGIEEPLSGVPTDDGAGGILLDGFKRLTCARQLGIDAVAWSPIGTDAAGGIIGLLVRSNQHALHLLEQARCVDELRRCLGLSVGEIARRLDRSMGWVSMRMGLATEMSREVRQAVFSGRFPARSYLYTLRHFTRVKKVEPSEVNEFVRAVGAKALSTREIDLLARGYFEGSPALREQIRAGHLAGSLDELRSLPDRDAFRPDMGHVERAVLRDLEMADRALARLRRHVDRGLAQAGEHKSVPIAFYASAEIGCSALLRHWDASREAIEGLYARCRKEKNGLDAPSRAGGGQEAHRPPARDRSQDGPALH